MSDTAWRRMWESYLFDLNLKYGNAVVKRNKFDPRGNLMVIDRFTAHNLGTPMRRCCIKQAWTYLRQRSSSATPISKLRSISTRIWIGSINAARWISWINIWMQVKCKSALLINNVDISRVSNFMVASDSEGRGFESSGRATTKILSIYVGGILVFLVH